MKNYVAILIFGSILLARTSSAQLGEELTILQRGPNSRVVERLIREVQPDGKMVDRKSRYEEVASGLHRWQPSEQNPNAGEWVETEEKFELVPGGAVARGQHTVFIGADFQAQGVVNLELAGQRFRSHLLGLAYTEMTTGRSVLIGEPQACEGELIEPNIILFRNALSGPVQCDVRYTFTRGGFSQDIICRSRLPDPVEWGFDKIWTRVEVWSVVDAPEPVRKTALAKPEERTLPVADAGMSDETLEWGSLRIGPGRAFMLGDQDNVEIGETIVAKNLIDLEQTRFLVEKVDYVDIEDESRGLPVAAAKAEDGKAQANLRHPTRDKALLAAVQESKRRRSKQEARAIPAVITPPGLRTAAVRPSREEPGLVLDYQVVNVNTNGMVFQRDTTYFVVGNYTLSGTTTFEGGTCIKSTNGSGVNRLSITGTIVCDTTRTRPIFLTSWQDNTVGETISGSGGHPTNWCGQYIDLSGNSSTIELSDLRVRHAYAGVRLTTTSKVTIRHSQFSTNYQAITLGAARMRNVLIHDGDYAAGGQGNCHFENVTFHRLKYIRGTHGTNATYLTYLTNCMLISVTNAYTNYGTNNVQDTSDTGYFQTAGSGTHYLANGSTNRNSVIASGLIDSTLLGDLRKLTTYPPLILTNHFTNDTVLTPQAQRDVDDLDLGYHYPPLDYGWTALKISNARLTLSNDVAIGLYGSSTSYGIGLDSGGVIVSQGLPHRMAKIMRHNLAQEHGSGAWSSSSDAALVKILTNSPVVPQLYYRFTESVLPAGAGEHFNALHFIDNVTYGFRDSLFASGYLLATDAGLGFTNCILDRVSVAIEGEEDTPTRNFTHSLFHGGELLVIVGSAAPVLAQNNLFDRTSIAQSGTWTHGWNGYYTNAANQVLTGAATSNRFLTSVSYQTGSLGGYYYPTNGGAASLTDLVNAGKTNAQLLGFYHYTSATNQTKEANSLVDIGFRYVATTNGLPVDTNGDGIADWQADSNGSGAVDSGEISWQTSGDQGFRVWITKPRQGGNLP